MVHGESRYSVFVWWLDVLPIMALQAMDPISTDKCHLSLLVTSAVPRQPLDP